MKYNDFGVWLQSRRVAAGLSLRALAQAAGVGRSTLSYWEAGKFLPRLPELEAVWDALAVSQEERQAVLRLMPTPRAAEQSQSQAQIAHPAFVERAGTLPHGGDLLRAMRTRRNWTQEHAARQIGVQRTTLGRWERGEHFPDAAKLQTVCFVYGASEAELTALTCGRYSLAQDSAVNLSVDALEHHFRTQLQPLELTAEIHPGRDLDFLSMEAALWTHALKTETVRPLLAEVYAHHASYLRNWKQINEGYAYRCLELLPRTERLPRFAALAVVCAADGLMERTANNRGQVARWLSQWLKRDFPPHSTSWLRRRASSLLCSARDFKGAQHQLEQATRLPEDDRSPFDRREIQRYHASNLLSEGKAGESLEALPMTPEAYAPNRVRDALHRTECCLRLNKPGEAHDWLAAAYHDIARYEMPHWKHKADDLARRF